MQRVMKQKIKNLFNSMEEKYIFPIGRRTWQILSFVGLFVLLIGIIWLAINMTPTFRDSVYISKEEVKNNAVNNDSITIATAPISNSNCTAIEVQSYLDSIKVITPNMEWENLGQYVQETYYLKDEYGRYIYDYENYGYKKGTRKVYQSNPQAIPNIFQSTFDSKSLDSIDFCEKRDIVKISHLLLKQFDKKYINELGPKFFTAMVKWTSNLNLNHVNLGIRINKITNSNVNYISNDDEWRHLYECVITAEKNYSETVIDESLKLITKHQKLRKDDEPVEFEVVPSEYLEIIQITGESDIAEEEDLKNAISDFIEEIEYYDENGFVSSYTKYMKLYSEKLNNVILEQAIAKLEKEENRMQSFMLMGAGFLIVITIAIILLLFSIQNILKNRG
jgi:hypothetical protein